MQSANLVKIFKTFSKDELKKFKKFIRSPYFNTSSATAELFTLMLNDKFNYKNNEPDRSILFAGIYGRKKFSDVVMRKLFSNLNRLAEDFLAINRTVKNKAEMKRKLLYELRDRNAIENYQKHYRSALNWLNSQIMNDELYTEKFYIDGVVSLFKSYENTNSYDVHQHHVTSLLNSFAAAYSKIVPVNLLREIAYGKEFSHPLWKEIETMTSLGCFKNHKSIELFNNVAQLFKVSEKEALKLLEKIDNFEFDIFLDKDDRLLAYYLITQYLNIVTKKNIRPHFADLKWKYYRKQAELIAVTSYTVGIVFFISVVINGLVRKEIDLVKDFVNKLKYNLVSTDKDAFLKYVDARILRAEGKLTESMDLLARIIPKSKMVKDHIRFLSILNLFELNKFEEIYSILKTYKKFLKFSEKDYSAIDINLDLGFIKAMELLLRYKFSESISEKQNIEFSLNKLFNKRFLQRVWVIEKFKDLRNNSA